ISASRNAAEVLDAAGVTDLFDARVDGTVADELGLAGKPHPAVFVEAARRLGVAPGRAAVVEDALAGVEAGRRGGFGLVVGVARGGDPQRLRAHGADLVVADLSELDPAELGIGADPEAERRAGAGR
ncbi:MAG TPA: HAD-IA family hydrolase, partial [Egibacteraceae bacterium]|nr:HAD-IA family hydrolase [Egibacteraceae bacterium]